MVAARRAARLGFVLLVLVAGLGLRLPAVAIASTTILALVATTRTRSRFTLVLLAGLAVVPLLTTTAALLDLHSGREDRRRWDYERRLIATAPGTPILVPRLRTDADLAAVARSWKSAPAGQALVVVRDVSDPATPALLTRLLTELPARELATFPGELDGGIPGRGSPRSPTWRYVWIGPLPPGTLPTPDPATPGVLLRPFVALASTPWLYWTVALVFGAWPVALAYRAVLRETRGRVTGAEREPSRSPPALSAPRADSGTIRGGWFALSVFLALFAFRWPGFFHSPELNVDEAHTLAGAITLSFDPVYWRSVDGTTHGPVNDFVLLWARLFGWPVNFLTARVLGCALIGGALLGWWAGARRLWGEAAARLAVLPALAFFALSTFWDFVHYTSEHLSIFLLATAWAAIVIGQTAPAASRERAARPWALAGLALGLIPWAKVQGGPIAAVLAVFAATAAWRASADAPVRRRALTAFGAMLVLPSLAGLVYLAAFNLATPFWQGYVLNNLRYATQTKMYSVTQMLALLPSWLGAAEGLRAFVLGGLAFLPIGLVLSARAGRAAWRQIGFAFVLAAVALYASVAPGRQFHHYLLFAVLPFAGLVAATLAAGWPVRRGAALGVALVFVALTVVPQGVGRAERPQPFLGDVAAYPNRLSRVATEVLHYARPGERLGIWGYLPRFYVETGLPQATREGHNERELLPHPQLAYYRGRYLADLQRSRPPVFLDAVGPSGFWPTDRAQYAHETWPELRAWVEANYTAVDDVDGVRVYVRADRRPSDSWAALEQEAATLGKPAWRPLLQAMARLHERATHPPAPPFAYPWEELGPGYGYGPAFGHWDIVHAMIDVLPAFPTHVREQLLNDLHLQLPNGFLPGSVYLPGSPSAPGGPSADTTKAVFNTGTQSHPPLWVVAADDYLRQHDDPALRAECLDRVVRQIGWFEASRRVRPEGFFYNDILLHKWESGVDEGVRFDGTTEQAAACVDATAHVYWLYDYAAQWAKALGRDDRPWRRRADELGAFMRGQLWDDRTGFFYDAWAVHDPAMQRQAFEGMWPVVVGAATPAQANRVIDEWLLNPRRFFTRHPIATVGVSDPKFSLRMWRGPAWNSMTYWAARGCVRYGRRDAARQLLERALDDTAAQFDRTGTIWEYWHPLGGHPEDLARKPTTKRNEPWTDYVGHNPLFAMARLWEQCQPR